MQKCNGQLQFEVKGERLMKAMKIPKPFYALAIFTCAAIYAVYVKWNLNFKTKDADDDLENQLDSETSRTDQAVLYGIMFDAGSTGTRIHIFQFIQKPKEIPRLIRATFRAIKPGLSAYADDVDKSAPGINELLAVAKQVVPMKLWKSTPLVLKATAGLRLLPGEKAQKLLDKVKEIFQESPFLVRNDCVSIMEGTDEVKEGAELTSPCLSPDFQGEWEHAKITYKIKGQKAGKPLFQSCFDKIAKLLAKKVHRTKEVKDIDFYAFSYYYDLAVDASLIDKEKGGTLAVSDFDTSAKNVCKTMEVQQGEHPFLCMDLTYVSLLLEELGFPKSHILKLARKINNTETSWALGAILQYMDSVHKL
ncbi:ectonucleoside triphosphate diphosphohydrolase 6 isoform X4 [Elgaria multicarinata webbii]|uniref:ectonucleoside triphosphate diphosphohydrolase 6 isoform X4 n=1 Tax=Elgaria multicarinata webbii TaxID=159646 RepID=UPI002FCCE7A7